MVKSHEIGLNSTSTGEVRRESVMAGAMEAMLRTLSWMYRQPYGHLGTGDGFSSYATDPECLYPRQEQDLNSPVLCPFA